MRRSTSLRTGLLLGLGLLVAAPPMTALGSAPEESLASTNGTAAAPAPSGAAALLAGASGALDSLGAAIDTAAQSVVDTVSPAAGPCSGFGNLDYGKDGRLTIVLLGSDYRSKRYIGERMDVIIVATLRGDRVAMASIPRDTAYFPKAGGGTSGANRVNTMYYSYKRRKSDYDGVDCSALKKFTADIAAALRTEIDYYAMVRMNTFIKLVDSVSYVTTDVPGPIVDSTYGRHGIYFPKANDYRLVGNESCRKKPDQCHSALAYVRSRHGTQAGSANNDFKRAYRQHEFIYDAALRVRARGNGSALSSLVSAITDKVWTNVPKNLNAARDIYNLLGGITLAGRDTVVFGPRTYATSLSSPKYAYKLKLPAVRNWINSHFGS